MMWSDVPLWMSVLVVAAAVAVVGGAAVVVHVALRRSDGSLGEPASLSGPTAALLGGWLLVVGALAGAGVFRARTEGFPVIVLGVLVPIVIGWALFKLSPTVRRLADALPAPWAIAVQTPRIFGFTFLVLMAQHKLPGVFANRAGWGDIFIGAVAPLVAYGLASGKAWGRGAAIAFNVAGLADLVVAIGTGVLSAPGPFRQIFVTPSTEIMTLLPMVLVPVFLVPFFILVHFFSLRQLLHGAVNPARAPLTPGRAGHHLAQAGPG
ncbi:MAG TPA: hypothetical protein VII47_07280, partial [Actinomycetota bacterium]